MSYILSYLLCYLAVFRCNKPSCVVNVTPNHIVGKVWLQHQELGINLELEIKQRGKIIIYHKHKSLQTLAENNGASIDENKIFLNALWITLNWMYRSFCVDIGAILIK